MGRVGAGYGRRHRWGAGEGWGRQRRSPQGGQRCSCIGIIQQGAGKGGQGAGCEGVDTRGVDHLVSRHHHAGQCRQRCIGCLGAERRARGGRIGIIQQGAGKSGQGAGGKGIGAGGVDQFVGDGGQCGNGGQGGIQRLLAGQGIGDGGSEVGVVTEGCRQLIEGVQGGRRGGHQGGHCCLYVCGAGGLGGVGARYGCWHRWGAGEGWGRQRGGAERRARSGCIDIIEQGAGKSGQGAGGKGIGAGGVDQFVCGGGQRGNGGQGGIQRLLAGAERVD